MEKAKVKPYLFIILALFLVLIIFLAAYFWCKNKKDAAETKTNNQSTTTIEPTSKLETKKVANINFPIPIYMYHHIQNVADTSDQLLVNLSLAPTFFQEEMAYLKTNHYETLTLDEMSDTPLNKKVALTFDDGYIDIYQNAYPMMEKLGFQGTVFAITDLVGTPGYMNWDNLKTLQKAGWSIESHTVSHPDLANLSNDQANYQIVESKKIIEKELGAKVNFFCYPSGKYNNETVVLLKAAGYKGAVTTQYGTENSVYNLFELQRIRINGGTSLNSFTSPL